MMLPSQRYERIGDKVGLSPETVLSVIRENNVLNDDKDNLECMAQSLERIADALEQLVLNTLPRGVNNE